MPPPPHLNSPIPSQGPDPPIPLSLLPTILQSSKHCTIKSPNPQNPAHPPPQAGSSQSRQPRILGSGFRVSGLGDCSIRGECGTCWRPTCIIRHYYTLFISNPRSIGACDMPLELISLPSMVLASICCPAPRLLLPFPSFMASWRRRPAPRSPKEGEGVLGGKTKVCVTQLRAGGGMLGGQVGWPGARGLPCLVRPGSSPLLGCTLSSLLVDGPSPALTTSVPGLVEPRGNLTTFVPAISSKRTTPTLLHSPYLELYKTWLDL